MRHEAHTGLILAGGSSRRFGSDKSTHVLEGRRMIDHVVAVVTPLVRELLISVGDRSHAPPDLPGTVVADRVRGLGPLGGLQAGLAAAKTPWLLTAACDMPFLTSEALERLLRRCSPGVQAVVAVSSDIRRHPLCACYHRSVLGVVDDQLASVDRSMHAFLDRLDVVEVSLPASVVRNVNTPGDLP